MSKFTSEDIRAMALHILNQSTDDFIREFFFRDTLEELSTLNDEQLKEELESYDFNFEGEKA